MNNEQADRLRSELTRITMNPEAHDQAVWMEAEKDPTQYPQTACGTTGCLAGNAVLHAGDKLLWEPKMRYDYDTDQYVQSGKFEARLCQVEGVTRSVASRAGELFGLSDFQRDEMFAAHNSIADLWSFAIEFSDGRIDVQDALDVYASRVLWLENKLNTIKSVLG